MNADRLLDVATVLEGVPDEKFNLGTWRNSDQGCGTTACAVGWYCLSRPDCGLVLRAIGWAGSFIPRLKDDEDVSNWDAVAEHFGVVSDAAYYLFHDSHYPHGEKTTRAEVVDRIRTFVGSDGKFTLIDYEEDEEDRW